MEPMTGGCGAAERSTTRGPAAGKRGTKRVSASTRLPAPLITLSPNATSQLHILGKDGDGDGAARRRRTRFASLK